MNRMRQPDSETARDAHSNAQAAQPIARRRLGWHQVQRVALACFGLLGTLSLVALAGCPADLANPESFAIAGSAQGGMSSPALAVDTTCLTAVFAANCATVACHKGRVLGADLDLDSPGVNARLIDVVATHKDAMPTAGCLTGDKLIDTANPSASFLLAKVTKTMDALNCGFTMPIGSMLSAEDLACLNKYVQDVSTAAKGASPAAAGGTGGT